MNIFVTFLSLKFVRDTLISSGDDGCLYLWDRDRIIWKVDAHDGAVFALDANPKLGLVASGSIEGMVTLWRLAIEDKSNVKRLEKLKIFNLRKSIDPKEAVMNPEYNVQSVCIGYGRIVVLEKSHYHLVGIKENTRC